MQPNTDHEGERLAVALFSAFMLDDKPGFPIVADVLAHAGIPPNSMVGACIATLCAMSAGHVDTAAKHVGLTPEQYTRVELAELARWLP